MIFLVLGLIAGCGSEQVKGDYILGKETTENNVFKIAVVHQVTENEISNQTLTYFLENEDPEDVIYYVVKDMELYNNLEIGERVTVKTTGFTMLSAPPQAIAVEIIRHSK